MGLEWKLTFSSPVATVERVSQICWHTECSTLTKTSFRILNSLTTISSSPLSLFVVMLPKAHLMSCSRMSDSRQAITPSWLSGSLRPFLYSSSVYSCHLFLISSYIMSVLFLSFILPIFAWNVPLISLVFLKRSLVISITLFFSISLQYFLKKAFLSLLISPEFSGTLHSVGISFLFSFAFYFSSFLSSL